MPLDTQGFDGLASDIAGMASRMDADGSGAPVAKRILEAAAQPIHQQMKANATKDPRRRSVDLHDALKVGSVRRSKKRGRHITIGVHRKGADEQTVQSQIAALPAGCGEGIGAKLGQAVGLSVLGVDNVQLGGVANSQGAGTGQSGVAARCSAAWRSASSLRASAA